ncbi:hypothetical protein A8C56_07810 [Niabella ginsenosidivorans]|uniref:Uncharacterized protein n=1 Tax=Niabella ginsenosidivorans TaxID=1176587 RepID=A0A1A9HZR6_9BACT|nr:hypothetical protein [Niabella ginsenosidivorans]ANH80897.1 hypothetical protein A8C56_07810 [Niabella ginsenosidivorans]
MKIVIKSLVTDPGVKAFGKMMGTDHSEPNNELNRIAAGLSSKSGAGLGRPCIKQMAGSHEKKVRLLKMPDSRYRIALPGHL